MTNNNRTAFIVIAMLLVGVAALLVISNHTLKNDEVFFLKEGNVSKFTSQEEFTSFLKSRQSQPYYNVYARGEESSALTASGSAQAVKSQDSSSAPTVANSDGGNQYSTTNLQIAGVDEPDFVKNDGEYIYIASYSNLSIVKAYPAADARLLATLDVNGSTQNLFLRDNILIVFGTENYYARPMPVDDMPVSVGVAARESVSPPSTGAGSSGSSVGSSTPSTQAADAVEGKMALIAPDYYYQPPRSFIKIYDLTDKTSPVLKREVYYDGSYYDARMIGSTIYTILNQPVRYNYYDKSDREEQNDSLQLPTIQDNGVVKTIVPTDIYYFDVPDYSYQLTTILAIDLADDTAFEKKSFLTGYTQTIFVSENNIYLTAQKQYDYASHQKRITQEVVLSVVDETTAQKVRDVLASDRESYEQEDEIRKIVEIYYNKLTESEKKEFMERVQNKTQEVEEQIMKETQRTIVHKIAVDGLNVAYQGRGEVPGVLLNQFSMDEHDGYFRVATTTGESWRGNSVNNIYVLDEDLNIVGSLEDLAKGERIYSARFMGDRAYMVTFKNTDPLFVIDLADPSDPKVLGELKIPGYSDYLHPYDENHVIGIGKDSADGSQPTNANFAYYQGLKLSLFDVTDVANPKEVSKFSIGDRGTYSEALYDHKAFLFDREKGLLVIPVSLYEVKREQYKDGIVPPEAYGTQVFEGAYVFSLTLEKGFVYQGRITHLNESEQSQMLSQQYYYAYGAQIRRSLYIDNTLYTISERAVRANDLATLEEVKTVELPMPSYNYGPILY